MPFLNEIVMFLLGFGGAFIGSIAGGYGLIVLPIMLLLGIPPAVALGTFNFGDLGYKVGGILGFRQHKNLGVSWRDVLILTLIAVPATAIGSLAVVSIDPEILTKLIGILLFVLVPLLFASKNLGITEDRAIGKRRVLSHMAFFLTRAWAGFFSPGSGLLETYVKIRGYGYTILQGKAVTRIPYLISGIGSVLIFMQSGLIDYKLAIILFCGTFLGGYIGTVYAIRKGDAWIKPILILMILGTAIKMVFFS
ncbi:MAG: sulfite exporter TauE/SafE family protein [Minisyncoccia bacterium]